MNVKGTCLNLRQREIERMILTLSFEFMVRLRRNCSRERCGQKVTQTTLFLDNLLKLISLGKNTHPKVHEL